MPTISKEDYLKSIYLLSVGDGVQDVAIKRLSDKLKVSKAAASEMVKKLSQIGLVTNTHYSNFSLTSEGERLALIILRKHRLWELFLSKVLHYSWTEVHTEAELLEHSTSDKLIDRIDEYLGYPKYDPHGDPIPDKAGNVEKVKGLMRLSEIEINSEYFIRKVNDFDSQLIEYFNKIGLRLNSSIKITAKIEYDDSFLVLVAGEEKLLSKKACDNIFVILPRGGGNS